MATVAAFNNQNIEFARQVLVNKMTRPVPCIALYPTNSSDTKLLVQVAPAATVIAIRYIASIINNYSVSFVGKSTETVVSEINALNIPLKAKLLSNIDILETGDILSTSSGYVEIPNGFTVNDRITSNGIVLRCKKIIVKHKNNSKIKLLNPYIEDPSLPWYPRVSNGSFSQKYNGTLYHFYIKEFDQQVWSPVFGKPFKDLKGIQPSYVDVGIYQLPRFPVYWNGENITLYRGDTVVPSGVIQDIDINNGLIYLDPSFNPGEDLTLDYTYLENSFVYKNININGHFCQNPLIIDKYVVLYMIPAEGSLTANKKTVFHTVGDSIDQAIGSIQLEDPSSPVAIIGAYNIQQLFSTDKISILDTRAKGGGLRRPSGPKSPIHTLESPIESKETPIEKLYEESYRFWDIGNMDGEAYPGAAAVAVDLPEDLQELLSIKEIKQKASKFIAAGIYPSVHFSSRDLPGITGASEQISCTYNLDLEEVNENSSTGTIANSIEAIVSGAGWSKELPPIPTTYSGDWSNFSYLIPVKVSENKNILRINSEEQVYVDYLKSTEIAGVSWEERTLLEITGVSSESIYSAWTDKTYLDFKEAPTGQLIKSTLSFSNPGVTKEYKNIRVHSPYKTGDLTSKIKNQITEIVNTIFEQKGTNDQIYSVYNSVDKSTTSDVADYVLSPYVYSPLFNVLDTNIDSVKEEIRKVGRSILSGTYTSGHYYKYYLHNSDSYFAVGDNYGKISFDFESQIKSVSKILEHSKEDWSLLDGTGFTATTGLLNKLFYSSGLYGSFGPCLPPVWYYIPKNLSSGILNDSFSGLYVPYSISIGGSLSEISPGYNYDYLYTNGLSSVYSSLLGYTGECTSSIYSQIYNIAKNSVIDNIQTGLNGQRTLSGLPISTHWFINHNRLGNYFGFNLFNLIDTYEYCYKYNNNLDYVDTINQNSGTDYSALRSMFLDIENCLEAGYDLTYNCVLRGGIVDPNVCFSVYAYGWYVNNWNKNYNLISKTYSTDKREKYRTLFDFATKQLVKNTITEDGNIYETTTINNDRGPFGDNIPVKVLYPISQAVRLNNSWKGIAESYITTLTNTYYTGGLYYNDPYKQSLINGKELDILGGLTKIYLELTKEETEEWEPIHSSLSNLRGAFFRPNVTGSTLSFYKNYNSGEVESSIQLLKNNGINTIQLPIDYMYWKHSPSSLFNSLDHLFETCFENNIRIIPSLLEDGGTQVATGNITGYVSSMESGYYTYAGYMEPSFMSGAFSGERYVMELLSGYDSHPALLAWDIVRSPAPYATSQITYNSIAYLIDIFTSTPIIYNAPVHYSKPDKNDFKVITVLTDPLPNITEAVLQYSSDVYNTNSITSNPRIDFLSISLDPLFDKYIDYIPYTGKKLILNNYGDSMFGDYGLAANRSKNRSLPIIFSNLQIVSGSSYGLLYTDNTTRNPRQLDALLSLASGITLTGQASVRRKFTDVYFYPDNYKPSYTSVNVLEDIADWSFDAESEEDKYKIKVIEEVSNSLNYYNTSNSSLTNYYVPSILTNYEQQSLNTYINTWNSNNYLTGTAWTISGEVDYKKYNTFFTGWGTLVNNIVTRLDING